MGVGRKRRRESSPVSPDEAQDGREVLVEVVTLSGSVLADFRLSPEATVADAKIAVQASAGVPTTDQRLTQSGTSLAATQPLADEVILSALLDEESAGQPGRRRLILALVRVRQPLALSAGGGAIRLWDACGGGLLRECCAEVGPVLGVRVDWEGFRALAWTAARPPLLADLLGREPLRAMGGSSGSAGVLADWPRDRALSRDRDGRLRLWDLRPGGARRELPGRGKISSMQVDWARGRVLACQGGMLRLWDLERGELLCELDAGHACGLQVDWERLRALSFFGDSLQLWDLRPGVAPPAAPREMHHSGSILGSSADWPKDRALSWVLDGGLWLWDLALGEVLRRLRHPAVEALSVHVDWRGERALSWSWDREPCVWELASAAPVRHLRGGRAQTLEVQVDWQAGRAISRSFGGTLHVWDVNRADALHELRGHRGKVAGMQADWPAERALSWGADATLRLWDLGSGEVLRVVDTRASRVEVASLRPSIAEGLAGV